MFREFENSLTKTPGCTFVMVDYQAQKRGNSKIVWREQVVCDEFPSTWNVTEEMECNKTWKMMTTHNDSSQPGVLKMEESRWLAVKHGCDEISNGSKWCSNNK
jgi:hypothetical protein